MESLVGVGCCAAIRDVSERRINLCIGKNDSVHQLNLYND